ncbi:hypothetical protein DFA_08244 [Cavenderia fasciculata]|uniref:Uncharacterized protein n=1 Tax=Cavenderia fasciculata TaxID=261658 RepID=F4Q5J5_CACFS|nr:uncharacterized protein DFA_08244 [Cavenderia fasciculata]EGG17254.1 hypothetical protein DFA_08244 [Cavenderia fasciculata]|eukprot:XP_004355738.1 hypothetical protein DFA_08244 [Cavenderia fasciculata]
MNYQSIQLVQILSKRLLFSTFTNQYYSSNLFYNIITEIDDNGDIISLLLTCKKLYSQNSSSVRRSIQFKGIEAINDNGYISKQFKSTFNQFNLSSFKDILKNSISDHQVIVPEQNNLIKDPLHNINDYPKWVQQRITPNREDTSNITTALIHYYESVETSLKRIYDMSSIETLSITDRYVKVVDLTSISLLPRLERLVLCVHSLKLGTHTSLKSLQLHLSTTYPLCHFGLDKFVSLTDLSFTYKNVTNIGPGLLPNSLLSLSIISKGVPPPNTFLSLTSLINLDLTTHEKTDGEDYDDDDEDEEEDREEEEEEDREEEEEEAIYVNNNQEEKKLFINLDCLNNLKTLGFSDDFEKEKYSIEISVPQSIKKLGLQSRCAYISSQSTLPQLQELHVRETGLNDHRGLGLLSSSPCLKQLSISFNDYIGHDIIIPSTVEKLTIYKYIEADVLEQVVLPSSLTELSILRGYENNWNVKNLPESLNKLVLESNGGQDTIVLPTSYPLGLETLDLLNIRDNFVMDVDQLPSTIKYLSMALKPNHEVEKKDLKGLPIYSIGSKFTKKITSFQQHLPINITHLTCYMRMRMLYYKVLFRLDEIINQTNVIYLTIIVFHQPPLHFSIKRLDSDNKNVLVLENDTLQGGIITQQKKSINSQQQQYDPIYLYFDLKERISADKSGLQIKSGPDPVFPNSLTTLSVRPKKILSPDTFLSLKSLVSLTIDLGTYGVQERPFINLEGLHCLETFMLRAEYYEGEDIYSISVNIPSSIKFLHLLSCDVQIPQQIMNGKFKD